MGQLIKLDNNFKYGKHITNDDAVLANGSLLLLEPARDSLTDVGSAITNYATAQAENIGISNAGNCTIANTLGTKGVLEKTAKGGLHGIVSQGQLASDEKAHILTPSILAYMTANSTHDFALFATLAITRNVGDTGAQTNLLLGSTTLDIGVFQAAGTKNIGAIPLTSSGKRIGFINESYGATTLIGVATDSVRYASSTILGWWGSTVFRDTGLPSFILYRLYIEDLTVSGRTFDEVTDIEKDIIDRRFASGGRYADDTYTDPASTSY